MAESTGDTAATSAHSRAVAYLANERFHRKFTLPATADHEALIVSYADSGRDAGDDPKAVPTIFYLPGMFASRLFGVFPLHAMGQKLGVRVLAIDRPGMGDSTNVPLAQRLAVWLETVPALLKHLGIDHVALVSHSAGTIYNLNLLYHFRDILSPTKPFVALFAPFVHPTQSRVIYLQMAQYLPVPAFSAWHHIPRLFVTKAQPAFASSGAVFTKATSAIFGRTNSSSAEHKGSRRLEKRYGLAGDLQEELDDLIPKMMFEGDTVGADSEVKQCLKKGASGTWGKCDDYPIFVRDLAELERSRGLGDGRARLKIRAYFGETDAMIGHKGQLYMEECWAGKEGEFEDCIDFAAESIKGTDHDTVSRSLGVLEAIFHEVGTVG
ncbi:Alpha/Beta hydrolase protein [Apiospora arundinis]|uniref:Alpha/Beta hydrolase protein n=1 Tax=Apiospora arundinis TaxID=335852 RepID=A0ABR2J6F5_9PEZI